MIASFHTARLRALIGFCLVLPLCCGSIGIARPLQFTIVVSDDDLEYRSIVRHFEAELGEQLDGAIASIQVVRAGDDPQRLHHSDLLLSLGTRAARWAIRQRSEQPVLCALISEASFRSLLLQQFDSFEAGLAAGIGALYLDQPMTRIFQLAHLIVPEATQAGTLIGPVLANRQSQLQLEAAASGLKLHTRNLQMDGNPVVELDELIREVDVMVALPDKAEVNRRSARWLLYLSYRRRIPLIAFSKRYTEAGAVASIFSSTGDVAGEAAAISAAIVKPSTPGESTPGESTPGESTPGESTPGQIYWPNRFSVTTNPAVARSLNLELRSEEYYQQRIRQGERVR